MIIHKTGNIWDTEQPAIGHGVNCQGVMGSGIAVQFRERFSSMYGDYVRMCKVGILKPGNASFYHENNIWTVNIASQNLPGKNAKMMYLLSGLIFAREGLIERNIDGIALPQIGCGIGGLKWESVLELIEFVFGDSQITCEVWTYSK